MLQRAASNAYSWWWASHIRTKESKWLEENLHDMEVKVENTLLIIHDDGDSFAKRVDTYYRKRPELVTFVEEAFRSYRALAERYDHLSRELQNANRTIATVFPERIHYALEDDFENGDNQTSTSSIDPMKLSDSNRNIPKAPKMKKEFRSPSMLISRKGYLKRVASTCTTKAITTQKSGLTNEEALKEIDKLQKDILAMQTEKEFVRSIYENGYEKYWDIENQITDMQKKVCSLQDEFGIGTVIEDNEARTLMAATALKSCQETLFKLQEKHENSTEDARIEHNRIKDIIAKYEALEFEFVPNQKDQSELFRSVTESKSLEEQIDRISSKKKELEIIRNKIRESLDLTSKTLTMSEFAERIDELVHLVVTLETVAASLTVLINRLRSEVDDLHERVCSLEENKESLKESSEYMNKQLEEFKEKINTIKSLNQAVEDQTSNLETQLTEAQGDIDELSNKLQDVKQDEEEIKGVFKEGKAIIDSPDSKTKSEFKEKAYREAYDDNLDGTTEYTEQPMQQEEKEKHDLSETIISNVDVEPHELEPEKEGPPNWRHVFRKGLEDREKVLLEEYTSVLQDYKEVKNKLSEVENKNKDSIFDLAMQIRELKHDIATKDDEIKCLKQKFTNPGESPYTCSTEYKYTDPEATGESRTQAATPAYSEITQAENLDSERTYELGELILSPESLKEERKKTRKKIVRPHSELTIKDKFRADIDELLEENLEFWLRFSTSIQQIQKFQTSIEDLQSELSRVKDSKKYLEGGNKLSLKSDIRPIYRHMREIQTELDLWLLHNSVLKDELQNRFSSLCNIQEEISRICSASTAAEKTELSEYQAAKFQGEIRNMKHENNKVIDELQVGVNRVRRLKTELEKTLVKLDEDFDISGSKNNSPARNTSSRVRIPLRSFLFGVKLKRPKPSIFSCTNPILQKQYSDLSAA